MRYTMQNTKHHKGIIIRIVLILATPIVLLELFVQASKYGVRTLSGPPIALKAPPRLCYSHRRRPGRGLIEATHRQCPKHD